MRIIFQTIFSIGLTINSQSALSQVMFKAPLNQSLRWVMVDSISEQQPQLITGSKTGFRVTYMGSSIQPQPVSSIPKGMGSSQHQNGKQSLATRTSSTNDSLFVLLLEDSLRKVQTQLQTYVAPLRAHPANHLLRTVPSILPIRIHSWADYRVSSGFGLRYHPVRGSLHSHAGIDFPQPKYSPVFATADGIVDKIVWQPEGLGLAVYLNHPSGYQTVYGHLEDHAIIVGEPISRGQIIGHIGTTGITTGPHLHYSVLVGSQPVDPTEFCFLLIKALQPDALSKAPQGVVGFPKRISSHSSRGHSIQKSAAALTKPVNQPKPLAVLNTLPIQIKSPILSQIHRSVQ